MSSRWILLAALLLAPCARAEMPIAQKARLINEAKEQRRILIEAIDSNQDRKISRDELHQAYIDLQIDSARVRKQEAGVALDASEVSEQIFNLVDINSDLGIDKKEIEEALMAKVIVYKYRYLPTEEEKAILQAARVKAGKDPKMRKELDDAAALREQAKVDWDNASLQRKAKDATEKSTKALHQEMIRIDPRVKDILERVLSAEPVP